MAACLRLNIQVCGVGITYQFTQYKPGENVFLSVAGRWITSDAVFTLWYALSSFAITNF
jgi:hypothetical protein